jgi:hypothetical protein
MYIFSVLLLSLCIVTHASNYMDSLSRALSNEIIGIQFYGRSKRRGKNI